MAGRWSRWFINSVKLAEGFACFEYNDAFHLFIQFNIVNIFDDDDFNMQKKIILIDTIVKY